ncbi:MAG: undecaprenyl/decaprenyl-phosphate alpha-N-acetylglucosaminyl 1-phosphate transferase [Endomicrobia bacterium]|nr:undecaprenyl/decaprenyl-phosphate alpha-N-acetylglucosaminyl 1-phosphate transferase [Endomicrobiia bacterium]
MISIKIKNFILLFFILILLFVRDIGRLAYVYNFRWLYLIILSFLLTYFFVPFIIKFAYKFGLLDYPSERKVHLTPIPRIGGIAIYIGLIFSLIRNVQFAKEIVGIIISTTVLFLVSLLDDVYSIQAKWRLVVQILCSLVVIFFGFKITTLPKGFPLENFLEIFITVIWFVGIVNAVNFLDGIDGLVSGWGMLCGIFFLAISLLTSQKNIGFISSCLIGSCLGFLFYNWHPAKIFLGDCGSSLIGFILASISVMGWWAESNPLVSLSVPVLILSVPIYDMVYITISRIKNKQVRNFKEYIEYVGKDHIHHRLLKLGFNVPQAVFFVLLLSITTGFYSLIMKQVFTKDISSIVVLIQASLIFIMISVIMYVGREKI